MATTPRKQAESVAVVNWARGLRLTREALINDDLGILGDVPASARLGEEGQALRLAEDLNRARVAGSGSAPALPKAAAGEKSDPAGTIFHDRPYHGFRRGIAG